MLNRSVIVEPIDCGGFVLYNFVQFAIVKVYRLFFLFIFGTEWYQYICTYRIQIDKKSVAQQCTQKANNNKTD